MSEKFLCTPDSVVFRQVMGELVVIQLNTGQILYFTPGTREMLEYFRQPRRLDSFVKAVEVESDGTEIAHLKELTEFLLKTQILEERPEGDDNFGTLRVPYDRPNFLRLDEKTLDEIAFLCP